METVRVGGADRAASADWPGRRPREECTACAGYMECGVRVGMEVWNLAHGKKGIGIVGYGGFGEFIHKAWDQMEEARVVAVCDADPARRPGTNVRFYQDTPSFLADQDVDIVSIATPPDSHKELAIRAMRAGKHALVEKPLALSASDAQAVSEVADETRSVVTVNFVLRYNPIVETLREIVQSEVLGKVRRLDLRNYAMQDTVPEGHWFWRPEVSGGILLEHGVHFFDLAGWVIGSRAAYAWSLGVDRKPGMEDRVFAAVKYENDVVGTYWHSFSRPRPLETTTFHFAFDLGEIEMTGWIPLELSIWGWTDRRGMDTLKRLDRGLGITAKRLSVVAAQSAELCYEVSDEVTAQVALQKPKLEVYADSLRAIMADLIRAIDDRSHRMRVTLDDAIESVRLAEQATRAAHPDG